MAAKFGRRLRRGAATTAVAAAAMAAMTASQAPGFAVSRADPAAEATPPPGPPIDGGSPYHTDLPPLNSPNPPGTSPSQSPGTGTGTAESGIPATVLDAYKKAESALGTAKPGCNLPWELLAAIGKVESGHARGGAVDEAGTTLQPILGPVLDGKGFALIKDTDGGKYDGDPEHDRAVGPMQFIPSTWEIWGRDGNGDGVKDPNNIYDAALSAGYYLCGVGGDLSDDAKMDLAILGYNHSTDYLNTVRTWYEYYRKGTHEVPDGAGVLPKLPKSTPPGPGTGGGTTNGVGKGSSGHSGKGSSGKGAGSGKGGAGGHGKSPSPSPLPPKTGHGGIEVPSKPSPEPKPPTTPPTKPPTTPPTTPAQPAALDSVGARELTATAGDEFAAQPRVKAKDKAGKPVAGVRVQYEIVGKTKARFPGDATRASVVTGRDGTATAPKLSAGEQAGAFTVRATVPGQKLAAVDFAATVTARPAPTPKADALTRTGTGPLTAEAGSSFAGHIGVKATYRGKLAAGVPVTATMVAPGAGKPTENDKGPYFKAPGSSGAGGDAAGKAADGKGKAADKPIRSLSGLKTDANGVLTLPEIFTDGHTGTFQLRLTTADGAVLTIDLTVTAPAAR
ncbi:lytic transglycosylase domain-containing protein [Streptomyces sp. NPDC050617]|uniref:lytic transglycosylase domain-containing protein n=1 Tax=Streptomyces sp. NPDC050617 TaxID=3154628 RepID=UPI00342E5A06